jgi:hypothetical protein
VSSTGIRPVDATSMLVLLVDVVSLFADWPPPAVRVEGVGVLCAAATLAKSHTAIGSVLRIRDEDMSSLSSSLSASRADPFGRDREGVTLTRRH